MFASRLNSGFRVSLPIIGSLYAVLTVLNLFAKNLNENYYYPNIFYNYLVSQINSPTTIFLFNHLFILVSLTLVLYIISNADITEKTNCFPLFIFLTLNISVAGNERVSLFLLNNLLLLYVLHKLLDTYRKDFVLSDVFNAGFWAALSLYVNIANIFIFPVILIALLMLRPFNMREHIVCLLGILSPLVIYESMAYLMNFNQWYIFKSLQELFSNFKTPAISFHSLPLLCCVGLLSLVALFYFLGAGFGNTVKKQKAKSVFFWFILFVSPSVFTSGVNYAGILLFYSIPLSFIIGDYLYLMKNKKIANIYLFLLCGTLLYFVVSKTGWFNF